MLRITCISFFTTKAKTCPPKQRKITNTQRPSSFMSSAAINTDAYALLRVGSVPATFAEIMRTNNIIPNKGEGKYYNLTARVGSADVSKSSTLVYSLIEKKVIASSMDAVLKALDMPRSPGGTVKFDQIPGGLHLYVMSTSPNRKVEADSSVIILNPCRDSSASPSPTGSTTGTLVPSKTAVSPTTKLSGTRRARSPSNDVVEVKPPAQSAKTAALGSPSKHQSASHSSPSPASSSSDNNDKIILPFRQGTGTPWTAVGPQHVCPGWFWINQLWLSHTGQPDNTALAQLPLPKFPSVKIAAFDFDGCLAKTSLFRKGPDAWGVLFPGAAQTVLKELRNAGYTFVIMSNQAEIGKSVNAREKLILEKRGRFEGFLKEIGEPCLIMAATASTKDESDKYRKPRVGMWDTLESTLNGGTKICRKTSFFVGDAAGRKKDHSDTDKKYAAAVGVPFFTEDECFKDFAYRKLIS